MDKMREAMVGRTVSEETRQRMSESHRGVALSDEHVAACVAGRAARTEPRKYTATPKVYAALALARAAKGPTRPELALRVLLDLLGVEFYEQEPIGVYTVDAFVPRIGLVVEADGAYWHGNAAKERARDAYLLRNEKVAAIVHLSEAQLAPWTPKERFSVTYRTR